MSEGCLLATLSTFAGARPSREWRELVWTTIKKVRFLEDHSSSEDRLASAESASSTW